LHPGITLEKVRENTSFALEPTSELTTTAEPSDQELELLRTRVDPRRYIIGRC
jgi:glutaconate CoA-transferase subunit B